MNILQRDKLGILAALVLVAAGIIRIPNGSEMRSLIRVFTETFMLFGLGMFFYFSVNRWVGVFIILCAVMSVYPRLDFNAYWRREAIMYGAVWYAFIHKLVKDYRPIITAIRVIVLANAMVGMMQFCGLDPYNIFSFGLFKSSFDGAPVGLMTNSNEFAAILALGAAFFIDKKWALCFPLIFFCLFVSRSSVAVIACVISITIWFMSHKNYIPSIIMAVIGAVFVLFVDSGVGESLGIRMDFLHRSFNIIIANPLGVGLGHWHVHANQLHAHNDIVQIITELGVLSVIPILGVALSHIGKCNLMALSSILILSCFSFVWFMPSVALMMVTILAMKHEKVY